MMRPRRPLQAEAPGLAARRIAADLIEGVLRRCVALDEQLDGERPHPAFSALEERDRALARMLVGTVLRRLGSLRFLFERYLTQGLPKDSPRVESALFLGAAQILWLEVPDHAAVDLSVRLVQADRRGAPYSGLVNAVLRRVVRDGQADLESAPTAINTPAWLFRRWSERYGDDTARAIAAAQSHPPALDITVKDDAESWASRLRGRVLPTGSIRSAIQGPVSRLPGYDQGAWWVQDAAAALPAKLLGEVEGQTVADLCAAPGGKAAQLAHAGARLTGVDRSANRLALLRKNFLRLGLHAEFVTADATGWDGGPFDAVLLDPPCLATGTIRRHPDVAWLKREADISSLADLQRRLLDRAVDLTAPRGRLVYCVCSLEPEEGEEQIAALLARNRRVRRMPVRVEEVAGLDQLITPEGDVRTLPCHLGDAEPRMAGLDGFYAARLERM